LKIVNQIKGNINTTKHTSHSFLSKELKLKLLKFEQQKSYDLQLHDILQNKFGEHFNLEIDGLCFDIDLIAKNMQKSPKEIFNTMINLFKSCTITSECWLHKNMVYDQIMNFMCNGVSLSKLNQLFHFKNYCIDPKLLIRHNPYLCESAHTESVHRRCIRPSHLAIGSMSENANDVIIAQHFRELRSQHINIKTKINNQKLKSPQNQFNTQTNIHNNSNSIKRKRDIIEINDDSDDDNVVICNDS
jgi:hypothetical protein